MIAGPLGAIIEGGRPRRPRGGGASTEGRGNKFLMIMIRFYAFSCYFMIYHKFLIFFVSFVKFFIIYHKFFIDFD